MTDLTRLSCKEQLDLHDKTGNEIITKIKSLLKQGVKFINNSEEVRARCFLGRGFLQAHIIYDETIVIEIHQYIGVLGTCFLEIYINDEEKAVYLRDSQEQKLKDIIKYETEIRPEMTFLKKILNLLRKR